MSRAFRCCRPMFGKDKWFVVTSFASCVNESSMIVFSRNHVTLGRGRPESSQNGASKSRVMKAHDERKSLGSGLYLLREYKNQMVA